MRKDAEGRPQRRFPRFRLVGVGGSITTPVDAEILNLSLGGALVEHQGPLLVGSECALTLPVTGAPVRVRSRVVHSAVSGRATGPPGEGQLIYHTGLEFLKVSAEVESVLAALIRSYGEEAEGG